MDGDFATYWKKTGGQNLSDNFKDLILNLLTYSPAERFTPLEAFQSAYMSKVVDAAAAAAAVQAHANKAATGAPEAAAPAAAARGQKREREEGDGAE